MQDNNHAVWHGSALWWSSPRRICMDGPQSKENEERHGASAWNQPRKSQENQAQPYPNHSCMSKEYITTVLGGNVLHSNTVTRWLIKCLMKMHNKMFKEGRSGAACSSDSLWKPTVRGWGHQGWPFEYDMSAVAARAVWSEELIQGMLLQNKQ